MKLNNKEAVWPVVTLDGVMYMDPSCGTLDPSKSSFFTDTTCSFNIKISGVFLKQNR